MITALESLLKARRRKTVPAHITREARTEESRFNTSVALFQLRTRLQEIFPDMDEEDIQKLALKISWIYADIDFLSGAAIGAEEEIRKLDEDGRTVKDPDHPFLKLWAQPNAHMSREYLMAWIVYWMQISDRGAFIYMAPDRDNPSEIAELWPIISSRIEPIKDPNHFVKKFIYTTGGIGTTRQEKRFLIDADFVMWYRFPDPHDLWASLPPLLAALVPGEIESGISTRERSFYNTSKGIPLSIVSLDPSLSTPDFEMAKEEIRKDWEDEGSTVAITRGGSVSIKTLGFTQQQLDILAAQELNRNKIDTILLGMPLRDKAIGNGDAMKEVMKVITENKIWPMLKTVAGWTTTYAMNRFYPGTGRFVFRDVRTTDKALEIQAANVQARWSTVNEMREREGNPPMEVTQLPGYGDLPVQLATNIAFLSAMYGFDINPQPGDDQQRKEPKVGNLPGSISPEALVGDIIQGSTSTPTIDKATQLAIRTELKQLRAFTNKGKSMGDFRFDVVPDDQIEALRITQNPEYLDYLIQEFYNAGN